MANDANIEYILEKADWAVEYISASTKTLGKALAYLEELRDLGQEGKAGDLDHEWAQELIWELSVMERKVGDFELDVESFRDHVYEKLSK